MIVDSFTAVGGCQNRPIKLGIDQLRRAMDKNGVDLAMTFSLRSVQVDAVLGNEYIYSIAQEDARILPVAVVDPRSSQHLDRTLDSAVTNEAVALAFHMTGISCPPNSILFRRSLKAAAATSKPLIFVDNIAGRLTQLAEMTRDLGCRKVLFAGASYHRADELLAILEEFDHIYVENSWQVTPGIVGLLAGGDRSDRILFGSMAPTRPMRPALNMVAESSLPDSQKTDVLARNALRFLGREDQAAKVVDQAPEVLGMPQVPAIDVHCHFRVVPHLLSNCLGGADIKKELERFNIEWAATSATAAYKDDMNIGNEEMLKGIETFERNLGSVVVNPHHLEDSVKWLEIAAKHPRIAHVTINPESTYELYSSPGWLRLFAEIAVRKLAILWNTGGQDLNRRDPQAALHGHLWKMRGAPRDKVEMFRRVDELFPDTPVILGHGYGLEGLELAKKCKNFYLDLCTSYPEQNVYRRAVDMVGAERVVFGSDLEMISPAFVLGSVWEADLDEHEHRMIMRENACRILKLPQQA